MQSTERQIDEQLEATLMAFERALMAGDADAYLRLLTPDALVVVPGSRMGREEAAAAVAAAPPWDATHVEDVVTISLDDTAVISYTFTGMRGDDAVYRAALTSMYVYRGGGWRLALHQQTPVAV